MGDSKFRPKFHFTPKSNWINDPNGLVWANDRYHLFYQHNPFGTKWGHMSWGHASSLDLVNWVEHPIAIPEDALNSEAIFSGSAVIDKKGSVGNIGAMVACYTACYSSPEGTRQVQKLAVSNDGGLTFEKLPEPIVDRNKADFRDPKIFEFKDEWRMVVAHSKEHEIEILRSSDLLNWESLSYFGAKEEDPEIVWECPDLFPVELEGEEHWVLLVSVNPGGPLNGSGTKYFVGSFDGTRFSSESDPIWLDFGRDNYAGVTYNNEPNAERILIAWMNSWGKTPHPELPWTGAMTIPRKLGLTRSFGEIRLTQEPVTKPNLRITLNEANAFEYQINSELTVRFDPETGIIAINGYKAQSEVARQLQLDLLVDNCSVEVFNLDRTISFSFLTFAD
ncbi:MAG: hypothetical protein RIR16_357 [Actinomycetota bacterium]|jgi:fructan beta-fructosidase